MANKRLIDANVAKEMIVDHANEFSDVLNRREKALLIGGGTSCIDKCPTVDAVEVVHGYWIDSVSVDHIGRITGHGIDCSVCDSVFKDDRRDVVQHWKERFDVCPFCGAVMDGGNEDGQM